MMLPSTRSWVPGSSGSRRRCRIGFCKCLSGAPRLQVPSRQRRRIARPRLSGRQGGVGAATSTYLFTYPRERLLRDARRPIQRRNASSGTGLL